jgi:thiol-disulfide isomerase/thioredoxin
MLDKIKNRLTNLVYYKKTIFLAILFFIFIMIGIYVYKVYKQQKVTIQHPSYNNSSESSGSPTDASGSSSNTTGDKSVDLYLFYTEWCPHCKKAKPEWQIVKQNYATKKVNGYKINFVEVDCDADQELASKFNVESYPTVKLVKGNQIIEFDAKVDVKTLEEFLTTMLSK